MKRIPVAGPWITQKEIDYVTEAVTTAWYENAGVYHERFERAFAAYVGREYAMALPSCTSALHLSLLSLGVGPGDEVIVPDITWIASASPVSYVGATPVFADIDPDSWCLSADSFEACISSKTKAVMVVDLYGNMPDMDRIIDIADRRGVAVIEDAAEAIGSEYKGKKAGSFGIAGTFSFHGSKTLTTGEGGMLVTDDEKLYKRSLFLRDHGRPPGDRFFVNTEVAYKYKMSSLQAALGLAQLERIDELVERKRDIFRWYREALGGIDGLVLNHEAEGIKNTYWMITAIVDNIDKTGLMDSMSKRGIDCRPFFHPLSSLPAYADLPEAKRAARKNENAYQISPYGINLPSAATLTEDIVKYVCDSLTEILKSEAAVAPSG